MFSLSALHIDVETLKAQLRRPASGACATFEGWVRNHNEGRTVARLEYEAYEALAVKEGERVLAEAREKFGIHEARCVHRTGLLEIGGLAVWVGVSAAHRSEAFEACRYIIDEIKARVPIWKKEHYADGESGWVNCECCAQHAGNRRGHGTAQNAAGLLVVVQASLPAQAGCLHHKRQCKLEPEFYSRQTVLREVGESGQKKLKESRVLVVGAGGLGSSALLYLASAGVGTLGICECDRLEASNLHRQILYGHEDVGKPKVELAAARIKALNPFIRVVPHAQRLDEDTAEELFHEYDAVLDCTDNFAAKFLMNDAAVLTRTLLIQASIHQFEGQLLCYVPEAKTACLRCLWPQAPEDGCVGTCAEAGVLGFVPGVFGTLQASETIKHLLAFPGALRDEMLILDLLSYRMHKVKMKRNAACPVCGENPVITLAARKPRQDFDAITLGPSDLARLDLTQYTIIDIREPMETLTRPLTKFPCKTMPLSAFDPSTSPLAKDEKCLLFCAHGIRSLSLTKALRQRGYPHVYSVGHGIRTLENLAPAGQ